jgi:hypothetical protein
MAVEFLIPCVKAILYTGSNRAEIASAIPAGIVSQYDVEFLEDSGTLIVAWQDAGPQQLVVETGDYVTWGWNLLPSVAPGAMIGNGFYRLSDIS